MKKLFSLVNNSPLLLFYPRDLLAGQVYLSRLLNDMNQTLCLSLITSQLTPRLFVGVCSRTLPLAQDLRTHLNIVDKK